MDYLYLHGFASGPQSYKGQSLRRRFQALGLDLAIPDLNQGDFSHLTLSRQIAQGVAWLGDRSAVTIIGSSFGGLTAAWLAQHPLTQGRIARLVLLAPAFGFLDHWLPRLGSEAVAAWQQSRSLSVFHYGDGVNYALDYGFVTDLQGYDQADLTTAIATLIIHGTQDEVIPVAASSAYGIQRPWVTLLTLDSDHSLGDQEEIIWQAIAQFLCLTP
ncbi:YqiA/YcfP family alpha/beta fold hydrolase [Leptolyngbya sp. PCC 6406]|uniref:YqiA/YcfP family alpha/beta fold hydrolase n=1 Tax=Leptolyngbya sp. PCC 6406 TaxID=1173264 RepID=UPI0002ACDCAB|nr:YqiA/YcfP family alpha/beta fold hydrolase [Leptolyngbya sp. PCC 6406]